MSQDPAVYLDMSTEELCDRADEGDKMARAVIQARFMGEIFKPEVSEADDSTTFTAEDMFPGHDDEFYRQFDSCISQDD